MRVGILTQYYPPEIGAPQARLSELAARLRDHGHEVVVLSAMPNYPRGRIYDGYGGLSSREDRDGVTVVRSWVWPTLSTAVLPRTASYFSFVLSSLVVGGRRLPRLDVLITESPPLLLGLTGFALSRLKTSAVGFQRRQSLARERRRARSSERHLQGDPPRVCVGGILLPSGVEGSPVRATGSGRASPVASRP